MAVNSRHSRVTSPGRLVLWDSSERCLRFIRVIRPASEGGPQDPHPARLSAISRHADCDRLLVPSILVGPPGFEPGTNGL